MPPESLHVVTLKSANAKIVVSPDEADFKDLEIAYPVFSEHVEKRYIRDSTGRVLAQTAQTAGVTCIPGSGGDTQDFPWKMLWDEPTPPNQADQFDRLVNSACLPRNENPGSEVRISINSGFSLNSLTRSWGFLDPRPRSRFSSADSQSLL